MRVRKKRDIIASRYRDLLLGLDGKKRHRDSNRCNQDMPPNSEPCKILFFPMIDTRKQCEKKDIEWR
jgi:hypothetical protein